MSTDELSNEGHLFYSKKLKRIEFIHSLKN